LEGLEFSTAVDKKSLLRIIAQTGNLDMNKILRFSAEMCSEPLPIWGS
jgi:hypothetical protein